MSAQMQEVGEKIPWEMKVLKPIHVQMCALLAQGMKRIDVATACDFTPEYITMLCAQPLVKEEIRRITEVAGARLEAMFEQSVDCIAETMRDGSHADKMKAVRLQLEATKRIGRPDPNAGVLVDNTDRLERLAERLIGLQSNVQMRVYNAQAEDVPFKEVRVVGSVLIHQEAQGDEDLTDGSTLEDC